MRFPYFFAWKRGPVWSGLYRRPCRVIARGSLNSALVEFEDGRKFIISRNALRRRK